MKFNLRVYGTTERPAKRNHNLIVNHLKVRSKGSDDLESRIDALCLEAAAMLGMYYERDGMTLRFLPDPIFN